MHQVKITAYKIKPEIMQNICTTLQTAKLNAKEICDEYVFKNGRNNPTAKALEKDLSKVTKLIEQLGYK